MAEKSLVKSAAIPTRGGLGLAGRAGKAAYGCLGETDTLKNSKVQVVRAQKYFGGVATPCVWRH